MIQEDVPEATIAKKGTAELLISFFIVMKFPPYCSVFSFVIIIRKSTKFDHPGFLLFLFLNPVNIFMAL
ncbi:hypothetical protein COE25_18735 [Bacillus sp. AFS031507]|nr:hypothetical protein COE25_18735 [Bacillus sp. AFS031507]